MTKFSKEDRDAADQIDSDIDSASDKADAKKANADGG